jgi:hypothetical protein
VRPRWFCRDEREWLAFALRLKQMPCPHCDAVGELIRHGVLLGYDENCPPRKTVRARRVFCSNRDRRRGCGLTFSVWFADTIRRRSVTTRTLWNFLQRVVRSSVAAAIRATGFARSERTLQRLWKRFDQSQSAIRTALLGRCPLVPMPAEPTSELRRPAAAQVLAHLAAAFPDADCPIAAFQHSMRTFFV